MLERDFVIRQQVAGVSDYFLYTSRLQTKPIKILFCMQAQDSSHDIGNRL